MNSMISSLHKTLRVAGLIFLCLASPLAAQTYDLVIKGGRVIDPETKLDAVRDVGINGNKIAAISESALTGEKYLNASAMIVSPGFIDLHAHGQAVPADRMQGFDGVTTALELENGTLPIAAWYADQAKAGRVLNYGASAAWTYARIHEFEGIAPEPDLLWFQKAFPLKKWVNDPAKLEQIDRITASLEDGLRQGGLGIGINAGYAPGGGFRELLAVHELAAKYNVPTFTHISCDSPYDPKSSAECVGQIVALASSAGDHAHICHINSSSQKAVRVTTEMISRAEKHGIDVTTESYTYGASSTTIGAALFEAEQMMAKGVNEADIEYNGKRLDEASFQSLRQSTPGAVIVWHFLDLPKDQAYLDKAVMFPGGAIASDAMPWIDTKTNEPILGDIWPMPPTAYAHPRSAGTYTRFLAQWVRERKLLDWSDAIRKCSLIPAQILEKGVPQMKKKGRLQVGMDADVIVFDPAIVQDKATFSEPYHPAVGMKFVLVNGVPVIEGGKLLLDAKPGEPIRRIVQP